MKMNLLGHFSLSCVDVKQHGQPALQQGCIIYSGLCGNKNIECLNRPIKFWMSTTHYHVMQLDEMRCLNDAYALRNITRKKGSEIWLFHPTFPSGLSFTAERLIWTPGPSSSLPPGDFRVPSRASPGVFSSGSQMSSLSRLLLLGVRLPFLPTA